MTFRVNPETVADAANLHLGDTLLTNDWPSLIRQRGELANRVILEIPAFISRTNLTVADAKHVLQVVERCIEELEQIEMKLNTDCVDHSFLQSVKSLLSTWKNLADLMSDQFTLSIELAAMSALIDRD
jgi:hypothetical protein